MLKKSRWLFAVLAAMLLCTACKEEKPNDTKADLKEYYGYEEISGKDSYIAICDGNKIGMGFVEDNEAYIPYIEVRKSIDNKCYVDENEKIFVYTTADNIYDSYLGNSEYVDFDGNKNNYSCVIAKEYNGNYYISAKFLAEVGLKMEYKTIKEPNRIVMVSKWTNNVATAKEDTVLRIDSSDRTEILASVNKGDILKVISEKENFKLVTDINGVTGYIVKSALGDEKEETVKRDKLPAEYTHLNRETKICLGWHQMSYESGNDNFNSLVSDAAPLNVISPTWFKLADASGNIESMASSGYVKKAHDRGIEVWALVNDFDKDDEGNYLVAEVLSNTSSRRRLIKNLVDEVEQCNIDGINVDFEYIGIGIAYDYVEFICELSVWCRREGIVMSVDMYVPSDFNGYYDRETILEVADYLIIMGYDEHWAGCDSAGSVASLPYVKKGIEDTVAAGDNRRVINAIPFYTRIWEETPVEFAEDGSKIIDDPVKGSYALDSRAVGLGVAEKELANRGSNIFWVEDLAQNYGEYEDGNSLYRIWLEDERSIKAKLDVMSEYNLGGVACWRLGLEEPDIWAVIAEYVK